MRLRVAVLALFYGALLASAVRAEVEPLITPRLFDEFGALGHCDLTARLDNFAIQVENMPNSTGYIVSYGPEGEGFGSGRSQLPRLKDYLVNTRGLADSRIKTVYGGRNDVLTDPRIQLWIVPVGARFSAGKYESNIDTFKGMFYEFEIEDFIDVYYEDGEEGMGPGVGRPIDASFADMLQQQKKAVPYVVVYNGEAAVPGSARRLATGQIEDLKTQKVDVSRIKTIFGGVRKKTAVQLWITGPNDPPPVADAGPEPPPAKNAQITSQADYTISDPRNERAAFNRMLEALREQPTVKAVVIITFGVPEPEPEREAESTPAIVVPPAPPDPADAVAAPQEEEPPPADLPKLVEKWRDELIKTHKINPDRFIVLFTTTKDLTCNYFDVWINPPGQPLPDPNADEENEEDTEALKIYENLPPAVTSTMGYRLGALIRGN